MIAPFVSIWRNVGPKTQISARLGSDINVMMGLDGVALASAICATANDADVPDLLTHPDAGRSSEAAFIRTAVASSKASDS